MLAEVEDLLSVLAQVLTLIYGALGILGYPTETLCITSEILSASIITCEEQETVQLSDGFAKRSVSTGAPYFHDQQSRTERGRKLHW